MGTHGSIVSSSTTVCVQQQLAEREREKKGGGREKREEKTEKEKERERERCQQHWVGNHSLFTVEFSNATLCRAGLVQVSVSLDTATHRNRPLGPKVLWTRMAAAARQALSQ